MNESCFAVKRPKVEAMRSPSVSTQDEGVAAPAARSGHALGRVAIHAAPPGIQRKLIVNEPGDACEQEADRIADEVMRMPDTSTQGLEQLASASSPREVSEQLTPTSIQRQVAQVEAPKPAVILRGEDWLGTPYKYAGDSKKGIDCSHFVHRAYSEAGLEYPYCPTSGFSSAPTFTKVVSPEAGDVVLFSGHMGLHNPSPPTAGRTLLSAASSTGVSYGEPKWFGKVTGYYRWNGQSSEAGQIQRKVEQSAHKSRSACAGTHWPPRLGSGMPLDPQTRSFFENRFNRNFSRVRIHTGDDAAASASALNARAFTLGQDITFGSGQYSVNSLDGRRLLAHELVHTIQQDPARRTSAHESVQRQALPLDKEELEGETTASYYALRQSAGTKGEVVTELPGVAVKVTIIDKEEVDGDLWFKIRLGQPIGKVTAGTECWVIAAGKRGECGVIARVSWITFKDQLCEFEKEFESLSLMERITKLRQMSHNEDLPFDSVIGTPAGSVYLDSRPFLKDEWQVLKDAQIVQMPDGRPVDVYHLLVGLDVLSSQHKVDNQTYLFHSIGPNYSAALYAGDIGAGAADAWIGKDDTWEAKNNIPGPDDPDRPTRMNDIIDRYYGTRAPESDLLADIDSFGVSEIHNDGKNDSILKILTAYYEGEPSGESNVEVSPKKPKRKSAIENFYKVYSLKGDSPIVSQNVGLSKIYGDILKFAEVWAKRTCGISAMWKSDPLKPLSYYAMRMAVRFILWLERLAKANGADLPQSPANESPKPK